MDSVTEDGKKIRKKKARPFCGRYRASQFFGPTGNTLAVALILEYGDGAGKGDS